MKEVFCRKYGVLCYFGWPVNDMELNGFCIR